MRDVVLESKIHYVAGLGDISQYVKALTLYTICILIVVFKTALAPCVDRQASVHNVNLIFLFLCCVRGAKCLSKPNAGSFKKQQDQLYCIFASSHFIHPTQI